MISIICFGNTLCSDDGIGYVVFRQLQSLLEATPNWQTEVKLNYAGNSGQSSLPYFIDSELVIVVDALLVSKLDRVGTVSTFTKDDLADLEAEQGSTDKASVPLSSHRLELPQIWQIVEQLQDDLPELHLFTIGIMDVTPCHEGIHHRVEAAAQQVTTRIMLLCREWMNSCIN